MRFGKPSDFCGNLPRIKTGPNKGRVDRQSVSAKYNFTIKQLEKAYWNWQEVFRLEGSSLTYEQYLDKMLEINITPSDVGNKKNQYNLSRYADTGSYTIENCRFITRRENEDEQEHPSKEFVIRSCLSCNKQFARRFNGGRVSDFCSRQCIGKYNFPRRSAGL